MKPLKTYLSGNGRWRAFDDRVIGDLNRQVGVVDERPGASHAARLVRVSESLEMGVTEQTAVSVTLAAVELAIPRRGRR